MTTDDPRDRGGFFDPVIDPVMEFRGSGRGPMGMVGGIERGDGLRSGFGDGSDGGESVGFGSVASCVEVPS